MRADRTAFMVDQPNIPRGGDHAGSKHARGHASPPRGKQLGPRGRIDPGCDAHGKSAKISEIVDLD